MFGPPPRCPYNRSVPLSPTPIDGPVVLRIAADALRGPTDYADDHIWEISSGDEPAALSMATTFGRRAVGLRIFPSFGMGGPLAVDPRVFATPASLDAILPSYLRLRFSPLAGLEVTAEYRVQDSQTLAGRLTLVNTTDHFRPVRFGLHAQLRPLPGGQGMLPRAFSGVTCLAGKTGELAPVVFLSGGAVEEPGTPSGLVVRVDLAPGASRAFTWAEAALGADAASFDRAREAAGRAWDAEIARLERIHARWVEVETGRPEWDAAFHVAQQSALNAFVGPAAAGPLRTIVLERTPDRGYSISGDGRDYDESWIGPSALEAYHVLSQMRWAAPEIAAEVLRGFFASQGGDGAIDARPGLAGHRTRRLCPPLLATLTLRLDDVLRDPDLLAEGLRSLWPFFRSWFSPAHDRDRDGWPEWDHPLQLPWSTDDEAWVEASLVEDPALIAMLYREADSLEEIARRLGRKETAQELSARRGQLRGLLARAWSEERGTFLRIDRDEHRTTKGETIAEGTGPGQSRGGRPALPSRVTIRLSASQADSAAIRIRIRGRVESGRLRVVTLAADDLRWLFDRGWAATDLTFASVESVEVRGIPDEAAWSVTTLDLDREDLTLLLPLWAGMVDPPQAAAMVRTMLDPDRYLSPGGLRLRPHRPGSTGEKEEPGSLSIVLNTMLAEGLATYGYRIEAADLLERLMGDTIGQLTRDHSFRPTFDPESRIGKGPRLHLSGLPPLSLFLHVLGVDLRSPTSVEISGGSPFVEPVVVRWRGTEVRCTASESVVAFPSGASTRLRPNEAAFVEEVDATPGVVDRGAPETRARS